MDNLEKDNLKKHFFIKEIKNKLIKNLEDKNIEENSIEDIMTKKIFYILANDETPNWKTLDDVIKSIHNSNRESNKLNVYLGSYTYDGKSGGFVKTEKANGIVYKLYGDLEEGLSSLKRVPIKYCDIYEKEHFIINRENAYSKELFIRLGKQYKKEVIKNSTIEAKHKLLYK